MQITNNLKYIKYFLLTLAVIIPFLPTFVKGLGKDLGGISLNLLLLSLLISPLSKLFYKNTSGKVMSFLMSIRGEIGILMAAAAIGHGVSFMTNPFFQKAMSNPELTFTQTFPVTLGLIALLLTIPLLITSNIYLKNKMGVWWFRMHKLAYAIFILGALHSATIKTGFTLQSVMMALPMILVYVLVVLASKKWGRK
jgi:sulfoxide reductase heme-binding subunit YedZ